MLTIRRFEEKLGQLVALGVLGETEPLSTGREAVVAGLAAATSGVALLACSTAVYGVLLAKGACKGELCARAVSGGVAGAGLAEGVLALRTAAEALAAAKAKAEAGQVAVCLVDGARLDGAGLVAAARRALERRLPLVLVVSVAGEDTVSELAALATRAVDGMDMRPVVSATSDAVAAVRRGEAPGVMLVRTMPFRGHAAQGTRSAASDRAREEWDPVARARARLIGEGVSEAEVKVLEKAVREEVNAAASAARGAES